MASPDDPCGAELQAAFMCLQMTGPEACSCFNFDTFLTDFGESNRQIFMGTQAFSTPADPAFCDTANDRVCQNYNDNQSCCCNAETDALLKCQTKNNDLGVPCESDCAAKSGGDGGGGSTTMIIIIVAVVVVLLAAVGGFFYMRRRRAQATGGTPEKKKKGTKHNKEKKDKKESEESSSKSTSSKPEEVSFEEEEKDIEKGQVKPSNIVQPDSDSEPPKQEQAEPKMVSSKASQDQEKADIAALKKKRHAIETWHAEKKQGSNRSLQDVLDDENLDDPPPSTRKKRNSKRTLTEDESPSRRNSKRNLKEDESGANNNAEMESIVNQYKKQVEELTKEKDETWSKVEEKLAEARGYYEGRLKNAESETDKLRQERLEAAKRIAELEAQNMILQSTATMIPTGEKKMRRSSSKKGLSDEDDEPRMKKSSSKKSLDSASGHDKKLRKSSSKRGLGDDGEPKMKKSSSKSKLRDTEELVKRLEKGGEMKRHGSKSDLNESGHRSSRKNSRQNLSRPNSERGLSSSKVDEMTTSWNPQTFANQEWEK